MQLILSQILGTCSVMRFRELTQKMSYYWLADGLLILTLFVLLYNIILHSCALLCNFGVPPIWEVYVLVPNIGGVNCWNSFLTYLKAGILGASMVWFKWDFSLVCRFWSFMHSHIVKIRGLKETSSLIRILIPSWINPVLRAPFSWPNCLPRAILADIIIRIKILNF